jgi:hypothetical protein
MVGTAYVLPSCSKVRGSTQACRRLSAWCNNHPRLRISACSWELSSYFVIETEEKGVQTRVHIPLRLLECVSLHRISIRSMGSQQWRGRRGNEELCEWRGGHFPVSIAIRPPDSPEIIPSRFFLPANRLLCVISRQLRYPHRTAQDGFHW